MTSKYELLKKVLSTIEVKEGLNKDNIIEEIQEELKEQDQDLYQEWEKGEFDVNHGFYISSYKVTLLMVAALNGHANIVEVLLEKGAHVNEKDWRDMTPLHLAALNGHANILEVLLEKGAHVNEKGWRDTTPLHLAAFYGHASVVEVLLEKGANVNAVDSEGFTPLHLAALNGHANIVEVLLEKGANVNAVDNEGWTPLDRAEDYAKSKNAVEVLLKAGGGSFVKARNKAKIAGGVTTLLGTAIAVALFTTGIIAAQLIPIVIAVVAVTAAALVVGCATYEWSKPSTKVDGAEKPSAVLTTNEQRGAAI
ncbi:ankyrin repeat domain-containing protein [Wolbachia pipientis]|uniref:ankyrin repeat domain-containing protein n=1 Tax=Wolbachia pipientis TaxID=955 RepID=UPI000BBB8260|nr:ankyrin repeat domain-containing protein [Wolbachia pipientis]QDW08246.1 ankyrin repeat domain-containing protein [Wolbachia pipientis]